MPGTSTVNNFSRWIAHFPTESAVVTRCQRVEQLSESCFPTGESSTAWLFHLQNWCHSQLAAGETPKQTCPKKGVLAIKRSNTKRPEMNISMHHGKIWEKHVCCIFICSWFCPKMGGIGIHWVGVETQKKLSMPGVPQLILLLDKKRQMGCIKRPSPPNARPALSKCPLTGQVTAIYHTIKWSELWLHKSEEMFDNGENCEQMSEWGDEIRSSHHR